MKNLSILTNKSNFKDYSVSFGNISTDEIVHIIQETNPKAEKICIVTDDNVSSLYFNPLWDEDFLQEKSNFKGFYFDIAEKLCENSFDVIVCTVAHGDKNKSIDNSQYILSLLTENDFARDDLLISVGGGMIGDVSGFCASIYKRGINLIHIPTTLLSMIDSCIGGKTAINFGNSKNSLGTFYNPCHVIINTKFLDTLPQTELICGLGESLKYSIIEKFYILEHSFHENSVEFNQFTYTDSLFNIIEIILRENDFQAHASNMIYRCLRIKKFFVEADPFDDSIRKFLNLGHTIGHAIESLSNYEISHGLAVLLGIIHMLKISLRENLISKNYFDKYNALISKIIDKSALPYPISKISSMIYNDKKISGTEIFMILPCEKCGVKEINISLMQLSEFLSV